MWSGPPEPRLGASHGTLVGVHGLGTPLPCFSSACEGPDSCVQLHPAVLPTPPLASPLPASALLEASPTLQQTAPFGLQRHFFFIFST